MSRSVVFSASCALGVLAVAGLLDLAKPVPGPELAARTDRADLSAVSASCSTGSLIAACATGDRQAHRIAPPSVIQVYERTGETILVRVTLAN